MRHKPTFVYFGTPIFSTFVLDELAAAGLLPALIVTTPDKPAGRGLALVESPVKRWAIAHTIPLFQPEIYDETALATLRAVNADVFIVAAYGKILPASLLALAPHGGLNVHPSLLPRYRGTSPIETQILEDEKNIGVSVILMDEKVDHGPIVAQERIDISSWPIPRGVLTDALWKAGGKLLAARLPSWNGDMADVIAQDHSQATMTKKIQKEDGELDLAAPARANYLKYLAYEGWPGTFFYIENDGSELRVKITKATLKDGAFIIERVIPEGKKEMTYAEFESRSRK